MFQRSREPLDTGIQLGQHYIVTGVLDLPDKGCCQKESKLRPNPRIQLIRLQNPKCKTEWNGAWAEK